MRRSCRSARTSAQKAGSAATRIPAVVAGQRACLSLNERNTRYIWAMEIVPGRIPEMLLKQEVGLLRADQRVFEAMLDGWRAQVLARGLSTPYIKSSCRVVERFQGHTNEYAAGTKSWLPALRDSIAIKVGYAYGLRRRELTMLEYVDFGPNPHIPAYGNFGAVQVRWAKGTKGSGPRRRTVLTVPQFEWVVELLKDWLSPSGRALFATSGSIDRHVAIRAQRLRRGQDTRPIVQACTRARRIARRTNAPRAPSLVRDAPDRSRLRPDVRPAPGRPQLLLDNRAVHLGVIGLQAEDRPAHDRPAPGGKRGTER